MKSFPLIAKLFIWLVVASGVVMAVGLAMGTYSNPHELLVFMMLGAAASCKSIRLVRSGGQNNTGKMSIAFAITYMAMLRFGPAGGAIVGLASGLSACVYPRRQPLYQAAFNVSNIMVTAFGTGQIYGYLGGRFVHVHLESCIFPVAASTLFYYLVNTMSVSSAIALSSRSRIVQVWHDNFLWTAPGFFAGASSAALAQGAYVALGSNVMLMLLVLPILYLTYYSYKIYVEKVEEGQKHIEELEVGKEQLASLYLATIESLATAIDAKDAYTREHISRVQAIALQIATSMGLSRIELEGIRTAALLHDIGKLGVPEHILLKPGKLSPDEYTKVQRHAAIGAKILDPVQFPWPVAAVVRSHHEKYDGTGYPDGLKGDAIPLGARVLAVADVYDALTSKRSYREGWSHAEAVRHVRELSGTHFDPAVAQAFENVESELEELTWPTVQNKATVASLSEAGLQKPNQETRNAADDIAYANHELMALFEVAQTLSATLNLQEALILLANKIKNVVQATTCVILLKEENDPTILRARMALGVNQDHFQDATTKVGDGRTGTAALTREPYMGPYDLSDLVLAATYTNWVTLQTALIAPLTTDKEAIGCINLYHTSENAFTDDDVKVLNVVAKQAAMAVQNARLFERTRESALRDSLTGLHNARYLFSILDQELNRAVRTKRPLSVLGVDLDNFKLINDNFGHERGDGVLTDVAEIFKAQVRDYDLVVRYAGDEFIIVLPDTNAQEAAKMADRIRKAVANYAKQLPSSTLAPLGVSVGLASVPEDASDLKTLLAKADAAMYEDKRARKGWSTAA